MRWNIKINILDDGFVRLVDSMGTDSSIVRSARVSYGDGTKSKREDEGLIRYLMRHKHFSPFASCQVQLHLRLPIYVHNQLVRHDRVHWNMLSGRYSVMPDEKWICQEWKGQSDHNKQVGDKGLDGTVTTDHPKAIALGLEPEQGLQEGLQDLQKAAYEESQEHYEALLELGASREKARSVLPMGQYTEGYMTANLGDLMLILSQRMHPHAQEETQEYAKAIFTILSDLFPVSMQAFEDYQLNSISLSGYEIQLITRAFKIRYEDDIEGLKKIMDTMGFPKNKRERGEFLKKMELI